jgi:tetratricopeptide (TPR) repeat protein
MVTLAPAPAPAQALSPAYDTLVGRYLAGDRAAAAAELATWPEELVREVTAALDAMHRTAQSCPRCPAATEWRRIARAALMLQTDCARQARRDGTPAQASEAAAARVARMLVDDEPDRRAFAGRWYEAMAGLAQKENRWVEALDWAEAGVTQLPESAGLLLVLASIEETTGAQAMPPPGEPLAGAQERETRSKVDRLRSARQQLESAQQRLRGALALSPGLVEARLRLGHVEWRLGQAPEAQATLEAVLAAQPAGPVGFLAHLFLGRLHEDAGRLPEAVSCYEAALALEPTAQSARLALSHVHLRLGDAAAARAEAGAAVGAGGHRSRDDPYWLYPWGAAVGVEERLEALRREVSS